MTGSPTVTLESGLRVANFSSPHPFRFSDGTVLPQCSAERAEFLKLESIETESIHPSGKATDIKLEWRLSTEVHEAIMDLERNVEVDVILIPFPVMTAMREAGMPPGKCRVVRVKDRVSKIIHCDRFCI